MAKWWEEQLAPAAPTSRLRRPLSDDEFFAEQASVEEELFRADRADDSQTQRALNQSTAQLRAAPRAVRGLARSLVGGDGSEDLQAARQIIDREAEFAPDVQRLEDIDSAGSALAYGRNAVLSNLPTMLPTIAAAAGTGGLSALAGAGLRSVAKKGLTRAVGNALTARTGAAAGALAGSSALQTNQMLDVALDEDSPDSAQTRAAKATLGAVTTGALDALPQISLLNRLGLGGAAKRAIAPQIQRTLAARLAREGGKQALQEGGTEAIQSLGERLTHKWVNDNVEVLGPKAFSEYLNSAVAGALVGGVMGAPAGIPGGKPMDISGARDRAKKEWNWFKEKANTPFPADGVSSAVRATEDGVIKAASDIAGSETAGKVVNAATSAAESVKAGAAKASETVQDVFKQAQQTLDPNQPNPPKIVTALFGKNQGLIVEEDSLLDNLENSFRQVDQGGRAPSDANGIIGRTQEDGIVRGGVPFDGFSLFNADQAQALWEMNKGKMTVGDAFVLTSIGTEQMKSLGDAPIKAAGKYLLTGDRSQVDEKALTKYLEVLQPDQRMQFMYAAAHTAENIAKGREASGIEELTPSTVRKPFSTQSEMLKSTVDIDDKVDFDLAEESGQDMGEFADYQQQQTMDEERPAPVALSEVVSAKDFSRLSFGDRAPSKADGTVRATNSKGNARTVSLAGLVARGWQAAKEGVFSTPNGVVDVVVQAIDTANARGMQIDPNEIQAGLWLGGETKLTPRQAEQIRNGLQVTQRKPVQETPGVPSVPSGERPYDNFTNESADDQIQGEDGIENLDGVDVSLRARTRSPLGTRVSNEGKLAEAETVDTEAADDIEEDQRKAESDAIAALHRANEIVAPGTSLKGKSLDQLMENFGKRVGALRKKGKLTKDQEAAVDGARRAIQRIERDVDVEATPGVSQSTMEQELEAERQRVRTKRSTPVSDRLQAKDDAKPLTEEQREQLDEENAGANFLQDVRRRVDTRIAERQLGIQPLNQTEQDRLQTIEQGVLDSELTSLYLSTLTGPDGELTTAAETDPTLVYSARYDALIQLQLATEQGREQLLDMAAKSHSPNGVLTMLVAANRLKASDNFILKLFARFKMVSNKLMQSESYAPGRSGVKPYSKTKEWAVYDETMVFGNPDTVASAAQVLLGNSQLFISPRQRAMLQMMAKSKVLKRATYTSVDESSPGQAPMYQPNDKKVFIPFSTEMDANITGFVTSMNPVDVFIHEATHALTMDGERGNPIIAKDIEALLDHVRTFADELGYPIDTMYGLLDTQEFLAEAFSNPEFQGILRRIPAANTKTYKNAWEWFKDIVAKLFKSETPMDGTALEEALVLGMAAGTYSHEVVRTFDKRLYNRLSDETGISAPALDINRPAGIGPTPANLFGTLSHRDRAILEKALRDRGVQEQIYNAADPAAKKKMDLYGPDLSVLINLGAALHAQGNLNLDAGKGIFQKLANMIRTALGLPTNKEVAKQIMADFNAGLVNARYDGEAKAFSKNEYTKAVLAAERGVLRVAQPVVDKLTTDVGTRMRESNNPALRKLATLIETRNAENAGEESYSARRQRYMSQHASAYMEAASGLKEDQKKTLVRALQTYERPDGALGEHFDAIVKLLEQYRLWGNANGVEIKKRDKYFPVVMDRKKVEDNWDDFVALLSKPEYETDIRGFFNDTVTAMPELVDRMVQIAQTADISHVGEVDFSLGEFAPSVSAQRQQIMGFITSKLGADRTALAQFQSDSLDAIMLGYINQMSKKAAYRKVFGKATRKDDGSVVPDRIGRLMAAAKQQGATPEQMKLAKDFVNMALGSYHAELNPAIRWVFQQIDKVWGSDLSEMPIEQWAHYQQVAQTYQNVRLLGLAALSSMIDPLGSLVRGGSVTGTVHSMWDAVKAMRNDTDGLRLMAEHMGVVEKYALSDAIAATYGGSFDPQGKLGKINNALFKYNGLEAVTRHSRLTALAMGHRFLLKHTRNPNEHSERFLKELGLTAADVVPSADPKFVELNPKTEAALRRFVNESVVRPSPAQRPGWHNDPNFLFAAQYKGYLYAFNTTIIDRMLKEAEAGNYKQSMLPLIPYLGVTVAAEMIRYAIQHPGDEDPRDELAYMKLAMVRSGMVGPRFGVFNDARTDTRYGSWVTNSWIGPTGQQAADLVDVATGERSFGKTAIEALPGSAIFEDWTFDNGNATPAGQQQSAGTDRPPT